MIMWTWEAMHDPETDVLGQTCRLERRLNQQASPQPLPEELPRDRANILLVTARPYYRDVHYRSTSRPLVELFETENLPANVTLLRPPTFDQLLAHLGMLARRR